MNEFICEPTLMAEFIQKLSEATRRHKIFWHRNSSDAYFVSSAHNSDLRKLFIVFTFNEETEVTDAIRIYVNDLHKTYTPSDEDIWKLLKELEWEIQECMRSIEATLHSMMEALSKM